MVDSVEIFLTFILIIMQNLVVVFILCVRAYVRGRKKLGRTLESALIGRGARVTL